MKIGHMGQEDGIPKYNRIGGGGGRRSVGRPCRGPKPKKVPQRGLGVAQLEKLRLEEEQKNAAANAISSPPTNSPHDIHLQIPNFLHSNQPSANSFPSTTVSLANTSGGTDVCWQGVHVGRPQLRGPHDFEFGKKFGVDPALASSKTLSCESNRIRSFPSWLQGSQHQHHASSSRMKGIKRPISLSLDITPESNSNFKLFNSVAPKKTNETISRGSGREFILDFGNSTLSEVLSLPASNSEQICKKSKKENKNLGGDFLSLAPPTPSLRSPSTYLAFRHQGNMVDQVPSSSSYNQFNQQQQQWYNFLSSATKAAQIGQEYQNYNAVGEDIDLNLKL
ncbi:hypothetical protein Fmac_020203 [Flemingia macrophylla]|uniref:Uncharacterized protein n=1 Tax=Flemingia macrophylla TaxID=520843 RepID=A0ABD1LTC4_9FABA